jgi:hypothetical protein
MHEFIERHHSRPWADSMARANVFEYMTYGTFARHVNRLDRLAAVQPSLCVYYWWPEQVQSIEQDFLDRIAQSGAKAVWIQSNFGLPASAYRALAERAWSQSLPRAKENGRHPAVAVCA